MAELETELQRLWGTHRPEIDARVATIETAVTELQGGALSDAAREAATRAAHQLAGTAGTFGFSQASEHAAALEECLAGGQANDDADRLGQLVLELRAALPDAS